jgi:uncharacterized protein
MPEPVAPQNKNKLSLSLDLRIIILLLLAVIACMVVAWKPWQKSATGERTVKVTGEATIQAEPDEFVFYPSYEFKNADKAAALKDIALKSDELVAKLKSLGVEDKKIKTNSSGYDYPVYSREENSDPIYTLSITVTVASREMAQKVQDYLLTTAPLGQVSPQPSFSDAKRKQLDSEARDQATKEARAKAEQSAKNLGFKVGAVKSVEDGGGFGELPIALGSDMVKESQARLAVQPGENELQYTVTVTYFVK